MKKSEDIYENGYMKRLRIDYCNKKVGGRSIDTRQKLKAN